MTEVGLIPLGWEVKKLASLTILMTNGFVGTATSSYVSSEDGILYVQGYNVEPNGFNFNGIKRVSEEFHKKNAKSCLKAGDVLTIQTGDIGVTTIVPPELEGANCHALVISRFDKKACDPRYYCQLFNSEKGRAAFKEIETGSTMKHLNVGDMVRLLVPHPPLIEQKNIASALFDMDELISGLDQLIAKKRDIKQAAMQQLLTGKTRLPGFAGAWVKRAIGELGDISGAGVDKKISEGERPVRLLNYMDVYRNGFLNPSTLSHVVTAREDQAKRCAVRRGDIFFTPTSEVRGDIGRSAVALEDANDVVYSYHVVRLRLRMDMDIRFRSYVFKTRDFLDQASIACEGSGTRYVITLPRFRALQVWFPLDLNEQQAIADVLFDMDSEIEALEDRRDKANLLKQGMMQELLTGRIRLV